MNDKRLNHVQKMMFAKNTKEYSLYPAKQFSMYLNATFKDLCTDQPY